MVGIQAKTHKFTWFNFGLKSFIFHRPPNDYCSSMPTCYWYELNFIFNVKTKIEFFEESLSKIDTIGAMVINGGII